MLRALKSKLTPLGARVTALIDRSFVASVGGGGSAEDQACRAARSALVMRSMLGRHAIALTTGRGPPGARLPEGDAIERAVLLARAADRAGAPGDGRLAHVRIDALTLDLVAARFDAFTSADVFLLLRERKEKIDHTVSLETLITITEARLMALEPPLRRVLRAASVFDTAFSAGAVRALVGPDVDVEKVIDELLARALFVPQEDSSNAEQPAYVFRNGLARQAAYRGLLPHDQLLGHRLAAEWLESIGETDPAKLAEHYERAAFPQRAAHHYRHAAKLALELGHPRRAIDFAERAIDCGASRADLARLRVLQAEASERCADTGETERFAEEAMALLSPGTDEWVRAVTAMAFARGRIDDDRFAPVEDETSTFREEEDGHDEEMAPTIRTPDGIADDS
jgi:hypothetical protein